MKKTLSLLFAGLFGISGVQAGVTLVSGFSQFNRDGSSNTITSDLGTTSLSWTLDNVTWNNDGTWTSNPADGTKTSLNVSTLGFSGSASGTGYTVNVNFLKAESLANLDSLLSMHTSDPGVGATIDSIMARYETGNKVGIVNNGGSSHRPTSGLSTAINFSNPFSLTVSVQAGGAYTLFVTQNGTTQSLTWSGNNHTGNFTNLFIGSWDALNNYECAATVSGVSFWEGAATAADVPAIINVVPEPAAASLGLFGLGALCLRRRRK